MWHSIVLHKPALRAVVAAAMLRPNSSCLGKCIALSMPSRSSSSKRGASSCSTAIATRSSAGHLSSTNKSSTRAAVARLQSLQVAVWCEADKTSAWYRTCWPIQNCCGHHSAHSASEVYAVVTYNNCALYRAYCFKISQRAHCSKHAMRMRDALSRTAHQHCCRSVLVQ